jgi:hypothetical protein
MNCRCNGLEHDEFELSSGSTSPSPRLRGEGWGEGDSPRIWTRGYSPSPELLRNSTSPRKRGEVTEIEHAPIQLKSSRSIG